MNESWGHLAGRRYGGRIQLHSNRKRSGGLAEHKMAPVPVPPLPLTRLLPIAWSSPRESKLVGATRTPSTQQCETPSLVGTIPVELERKYGSKNLVTSFVDTFG